MKKPIKQILKAFPIFVITYENNSMSSAIINKLIVKFDHSKIDDDFSIFQITTTEKYINRGAYILDRPDLDLKALSVAFDYGKSAFILFKKDYAKDKKEILDSLGDEKLSIRKLSSTDVKDYLLFRLFLYSLNNFSSENLNFNNLSGKLILYSPNWISKNRKSFKALDIDVDKDLAFNASATTFTSVSLIKDKKLLATSPKYLMDGKNYSLKRILSSDKDSHIFIRTTLGDRKTEISFLDLSPAKIKQSKAFYLYQTIDKLKASHSSYFNVSFDSKEIEETITETREKKVIDRVVSDFRFSIINVVDLDKDPNDYPIFKKLVDYLMDIVSPNAIKVSEAIDSKSYNIVFIHDAEYYKENNYPDPYKLFDRSNVIQCITKEDVGSKIDNDNKAIIKTCLKELVIKNDIINTHTISLDEWSNFGFDNDWTFGIESKDNQFFITIDKDGKFSFEHKTNDFSSFRRSDLNRLSFLLSRPESKSKTIISDNSGNVILISRTNLFTLPSMNIFDAKNIRSKEGRKAFLSGVTDINFYQNLDGVFYNVGLIGCGMNSSIPKASLLYKVETIEGQNIIKNLLKTMSVVFVKYNEFTVLPYPVKYLREYMNSFKL